ncbi:MBL fold metallo-hydrolase [Pseudomonas aeruginosa]
MRSGTAHAGAYAGLDSFLVPRAKLLIAGDTLFRRGIGRTDLWGGDSAAIQRSDQAASVQPRRGRHGGRRPWPGHHAGRRDAQNPFIRG